MNPNDKSALAIQPDSGIRLNLSNYYRIRTWQGGGEFWEHNNQQLIRDALGQFLPRATVVSGNFVFFEHYQDGKEICSLSQPVTATNPIPRAQLDQLRAALTAFKAKTQDPKCDPEARKLIDCFRLPDPKKDPELYRIYGSGKNKRLVVLWGAEKEVDSAVPPLEAINMVHSEPVSVGKENGKLILVVGLLVLLALLGLFLWQRDKQEPKDSEIAKNGESGASSSVRQEAGGSNGEIGRTSPTGKNTEGAVSGNPKYTTDTDKTRPEAPIESDANHGEETAAERVANGDSSLKPGDSPKDAIPNDTESKNLADIIKPGNKDTDPKDKTGLGNKEKSGDPIEENDSTGGTSAVNAALIPDAGKSPKSDEPATDGRTDSLLNNLPKDDDAKEPTNEISGTDALAGDNQPADEGGVNHLLKNLPTEDEGEEPANEKSDAYALAGDMPPESEMPAENQSNSPKLRATTETDLTETKLRIKETSPQYPNLARPAKPGTPAALPPGELEILKVEVGEEPRDGKVEVMLGLKVKAADDEDVQLDSATWFIDGAELKGEDGKPLNAPEVRQLLPAGKHTLSVVGRTKNSKELRGEARLDVRIKQQPISEVELENKTEDIEK